MKKLLILGLLLFLTGCSTTFVWVDKDVYLEKCEDCEIIIEGSNLEDFKPKQTSEGNADFIKE